MIVSTSSSASQHVDQIEKCSRSQHEDCWNCPCSCHHHIVSSLFLFQRPHLRTGANLSFQSAWVHAFSQKIPRASGNAPPHDDRGPWAHRDCPWVLDQRLGWTDSKCVGLIICTSWRIPGGLDRGLTRLCVERWLIECRVGAVQLQSLVWRDVSFLWEPVLFWREWNDASCWSYYGLSLQPMKSITGIIVSIQLSGELLN